MGLEGCLQVRLDIGWVDCLFFVDDCIFLVRMASSLSLSHVCHAMLYLVCLSFSSGMGLNFERHVVGVTSGMTKGLQKELAS